MRRRAPRLLRSFASPWLVALVLVVGGCQSPSLPPWAGGTKAPAPPPPARTAPQALPTPTPAPPPALEVPPLPPVVREAPVAPPAADAGRPGVKAALLLPLSGRSAAVGLALSNAAQLALFEVAEENLTLLPFDTQGTPEGAAAAAAQAVAQKADVVIGPVFAAEVRAAAPVARAAGLNMLTFSTDRTAAGDGVFLMGFLLRPQVMRVANLARVQGRTRFAALARDDEYGRTAVDSLQRALAAGGATLTEVQYYPMSGGDYAQVIRRLARYDERKAALEEQRQALAAQDDEASRLALAELEKMDTYGEVEFDALFIADDGQRLRNVAALLPYYDVDPARVKLLGTLLWEDPALGMEPALLGAWYPSPPAGRHGEFEARYVRAFGNKPPRIASLAYDATALVAVLARRPQPDFGAAAIAAPSGFAGVDGIFRLLPDGTSERGYAVMEIQRGGPREISPAPQTFEQPIY